MSAPSPAPVESPAPPPEVCEHPTRFKVFARRDGIDELFAEVGDMTAAVREIILALGSAGCFYAYQMDTMPEIDEDRRKAAGRQAIPTVKTFEAPSEAG